MSDANAPGRASFLTLLMSGADNQTPAIGRYLGAILFLLLLVMLPTVLIGVLLLRKVDWATWKDLLAALPLYVGAIVGAVISLVSLTNHTEPKPWRDGDRQ